MRYPAHHRGFTLIEMIVTVSVLAILLTIAVPSFKDMVDKRRLVGAAERLYGDVQAARFESIKSNKQVTISFKNLGTATSWCYGMDDDSATGCDCSTVGSAANCTIGGVKKVVTSSDFKNVDLTSTDLTSNNLCVEPRRGKFSSGTISATSCSSTTVGNITLSSTSGVIKVNTASFGRVHLCSPSGTGQVVGYPLC